MSPHLPWYVARATGIVAWALLTVAVVWGLLLSTRLFGRRPRPPWLLDLHRFLGGLALTFTGLHVTALIADTTTSFGPAEVLVPFTSSWKPGPVALGVVAFHLLLAVEVTSLAMRRIPRRWWRSVHATSFAAFWLATTHLVVAGTDAADPALLLAALAAAGAVAFLTAYRLLADRHRRPAPRAPVPARGRSQACGPTLALAVRTPVSLPEAGHDGVGGSSGRDADDDVAA